MAVVTGGQSFGRTVRLGARTPLIAGLDMLSGRFHTGWPWAALVLFAVACGAAVALIPPGRPAGRSASREAGHLSV